MPQVVPVQLADQSFDLRYELGDVDWFEQKAGMSLIPALNSMGSKTITWMLLAGVRHQRPNMRYDEMQAALQKHLSSGGSVGQVTKTLHQALEEFGWRTAEDSRPTPGA